MMDAARNAVRTALGIRQRLGISAKDPACPVDAADRMGVEVRYVSVATLEGLYVGGPVPTIFVAADRPRGRQAMTVAHELAHHVRGDGSPLHTYLQVAPTAPQSLAEERAANLVAAHFLMPRSAVLSGFRSRGFDPTAPTPAQVLIVAGWLGVGYDSLLLQLSSGLGILARPKADAMQQIAARGAREELLQSCGLHVDELDREADLVLVDPAWRGRPVDLRVGDLAVVPPGSCVRGRAVSLASQIVRAHEPGIAQLTLCQDSQAHFVRVMRRGYAGLARYRHLEAAAGDDVWA
jgi:hypothetical protein